ncbi:MAG TPA: MerR family transcriptional regulator [Bacillota bacterium]|nr:MerR family transcriptional regulator [Bacillota bacterium]
MNLKNCEKCGKIYVFIGKNICPECSEQEEKEFDRVRDYIKKHPGCNMQEVCENTSISPDKILSYLREGKLTGPGNTLGAELTCSSCGKTIAMGRLCERCQAELDKAISQAVKSTHKEGPEARVARDRMHTR